MPDKPHDFKSLVEFRARASEPDAWIKRKEPDEQDGQVTRQIRAVERARAALLAEIAAGVVPCPEEATDKMIQAACDATFGPKPLTHEEMHTAGVNAAIAHSPFKPEDNDDER